MIGRRIGSWIIERELGRGGMGSVFEARHVSLRTKAAVKVLSPKVESEESFRQRFHREADLQSQLRHPNIVRVLDYLEEGGQWFLIIEYLDRGSLADLLARGEKFSRQQALVWMRQALAGLGHAHQKGVVHRDVKPANLLLGESGEIVVADFGIARAEGSPSLTATGIAVGTPQYMSPEQITTPAAVDWRSDMYSLGVVLYELLAGRRPFDSGSQFAVLHAHVIEPPPLLRTLDSTIPLQLESVVMRALAKKPDDRFADCESMARELERASEVPPESRTLVTPPPDPGGGTIHSSALFEKAMVERTDGPSAGDLRIRRRRTFLRRMSAGVVATLAAAMLFAYQLANDPPAAVQDPELSPEVTSSTEVTVTAPPEKPKPKSKTPLRQEGAGDSSANRQTLLPDLVQTETRADPPLQETPRERPPIQVPVVPVLPERPKIAVIGMGDDPLLAGALEQEMERRLQDDYDLADEHGEPEIGDLLERKGATVSQRELGTALLKSGFHVLVVLRVEVADSRTTSFRGVSGSIKAARIRLNSYLLPANRSAGRGWTELVEYTELSAGAKARMAFIGPTADLRKAIDDEWAALRAAAAGAPAR